MISPEVLAKNTLLNKMSSFLQIVQIAKIIIFYTIFKVCVRAPAPPVMASVQVTRCCVELTLV